jgi:hypothetical protein
MARAASTIESVATLRLQRRRNHEVAVTGFRGGSQNLIPVERRRDLILTECVDQAQRVGYIGFRFAFETLDAGGMVKNDAELAPITLHFVRREVESGEFGHVSNIDFNWHDLGSLRK